jgi:hypothetical protein
MTATAWFLFGMGFLCVVGFVFFYACLVVSARCDRQAEMHAAWERYQRDMKWADQRELRYVRECAQRMAAPMAVTSGEEEDDHAA